MTRYLPEEIARAVPHVELPELYEAAKAALAACDRVDELDDCADKAAALASYARQADDRELENYAARIRARAVRRVGELLREIDGRGRTKSGTPLISSPSRGEAAKAAGLSSHKAVTAVRVASVPDDEFERLVEGSRPPGTTVLAQVGSTARPPFQPQPAPLRMPAPTEDGVHWIRPHAERVPGLTFHRAADPPPREPILTSADLDAIGKQHAAKAIVENVSRMAADVDRLRNDRGAVIELILRHQKPQEIVAAIDCVGDFIDAVREGLRFRRS